MAKKLKTTVLGTLKGEETIYQTTNPDIFEVGSPVKNPVRIKDLCTALINNPKAATKVIQVILVNKVTKKLVDYYSCETPKEDHIFLIPDPNDVITFLATKSYNDSAGHLSGTLIAYKYEIVDLKGHKETIQEFTSKRANYVSKAIGLQTATEYFMLRGNGISKNSAVQYLMIHNNAEKFMNHVFGRLNYTNTTVSVVLAVLGLWSNTDKKEYKTGKFNKYNNVFINDLVTIADFLVNLRNLSAGRLDLTEGKCYEFSKFYHTTVRINGGTFDCSRFITFFNNYPSKALGTTCKGCGDLIPGYIDRINNIGVRGKGETWENICLEISKEPNF
jgi:hypothetical protein